MQASVKSQIRALAFKAEEKKCLPYSALWHTSCHILELQPLGIESNIQSLIVTVRINLAINIPQ